MSAFPECDANVMKILLIHQNFPGQYLHLARFLGSHPEHRVVFITQRSEGSLPGVEKILYRPRRAASPQVHHYLRESEAAVLNAQEVARVAMDLRHTDSSPTSCSATTDGARFGT